MILGFQKWCFFKTFGFRKTAFFQTSGFEKLNFSKLPVFGKRRFLKLPVLKNSVFQTFNFINWNFRTSSFRSYKIWEFLVYKLDKPEVF